MMAQQHRLAALALNVDDPVKLAAFYGDVLGMSRCDRDGEVAVGYGGEGAALILRRAPVDAPYKHAPNHRYWKISITVPNLDVGHAQLVERGMVVTAPRQFREIAYLSHLADPEGHVIELIQHTFDGKPRTSAGDDTQPLGGGARLGLVTLRTNDMEAEKARVVGGLGMRYLSRQAISDLGFDLYFFAFTDDEPPVADINAVANREWLWQRPYTVLEFQHRTGGGVAGAAEPSQPGAAAVIVERPGRTAVVFR